MTRKSPQVRADEYIARMTLKEKLMIIIETSQANERLGIKKYFHGNEALHGVVRPGKFTVFPQAIALGAMFDDELLYRIADAISTEARARYHNKCADGLDEREFEGRYNGLLTFWSPDLNLARDPRWGRTAETYGEDPYLSGTNGIAFVRGLQGSDDTYLKAVATPKHFTANNEEHNRFRCNAVMSEKTLREYHLEPFRVAVTQGKCAAVMAAYNAINSLPCHENKRLLTDILRGEWGFDGYVVSDCSAIARLWDEHKRYSDPQDAAGAALNAGVDLECGSYSPYEHFYYTFLEQQLADGKVTVERIDEAVRRVLVARIKLGQFDDEESLPWSKLTLDVIGCKEHSDLAYESAVKSIVMLENNGILPLKPDAKLLVVGNNAAVCQYGDYSGSPKNKPVTPLDGIISRSGGNVTHVPWSFVKASQAFTPIESSCYRLDSGEKGVLSTFYKSPALLGESQSRVDEAVDFVWLERYPDPYITTTEFSCSFEGNIIIPISGEYTFRINASGYVKCEPPCLTFNGESYGGQVMKLRKGDKLNFTVTYQKRLDDPSVRLEWTTPQNADESELFTRECQLAADADAVVAVLGLGTAYEMEGRDKTDLSLPYEQLLMLRKLASVNKNIILVTENGSALTLTEPQSLCAAIIEAWYPGERGGDAIADILFGNVSPSGRLPLSFPRSTDDLPPFDDYEMSHGRTYMYSKVSPLYPFGFGLSYTSFAYSDISVMADKIGVTLTNTGEYDGDEVVQLYIDSAGLCDQPRYRLKGFRRVSLKKGETARVEFSLERDMFALYDESGDRRVFDGTYKLYVGSGQPDYCADVLSGEYTI